MTNHETAITIAINTFLSEYDNDAVKTYEMLSNELSDSWSCIDYATYGKNLKMMLSVRC